MKKSILFIIIFTLVMPFYAETTEVIPFYTNTTEEYPCTVAGADSNDSLFRCLSIGLVDNTTGIADNATGIADNKQV